MRIKMKHILEYNKFDNVYKVISYEDNFEDPNATDFDVEIESPTNKKTIHVNYELFLNFIQEVDTDLKSYLINREELNDFESIFGNLEELGFDYQSYLQKWVDREINSSTYKNLDDNYGDDDGDDYDEDGISNAPKWWEESDDDGDDD